MTKIVLFLLSIDIKEGIEYIVSKSMVELKLPSINNDITNTIKDNINTFAKTVVKANPDWLKFKIVDVINTDECTELWFFARIPYEYKYMLSSDYHMVKLSITDNNNILRMKYLI
jgi:hypothetical protein